jgi:phosphatidylserine/phosphatidylglycerophosphate/cardiolipin synthase-like enzyme
MITPHFGDIRRFIINELNEAEHDIYAVVAWITDRQILDILYEKQTSGVDVTLILVKDDTNLNNGFDYDSFIEEGGSVYWDDHHHKFCVVDRETVITGSYNWTYAAVKREARENILIIKEEPVVSKKFSSEFRRLRNNSEVYLSEANLLVENSYEIIEELSIDEFNEDGYELALQVRLDRLGRPYLFCIDMEEKKNSLIYMFDDLAEMVSVNQILEIESVSVFLVINQQGEKTILIGIKNSAIEEETPKLQEPSFDDDLPF